MGMICKYVDVLSKTKACQEDNANKTCGAEKLCGEKGQLVVQSSCNGGVEEVITSAMVISQSSSPVMLVSLRSVSR
jgi:sulfopyruvate decarboxylase TPP-binding subunit